MSPGTRPTVVVHSVSNWLPQTCTWLFNQVHHLPDTIESHVACESTARLDQFMVPRIHCMKADPVRFLSDRAFRRLGIRRHMGALLHLAKDVHADVLHSHFGNQGWADAGVASRAGLKHVVTYYGLDVNFLPRNDPRWLGRYRELFAGVDLVLCEGPFMARTIEALGCPADKLRVHHLGVNLDQIPFRPRSYRRGEPLKVYIAGVFREKKGIPVALHALGIVSRRIPVEITILGEAGNEARGAEEKRRIMEAIGKHGLESKTRLLGFQPYSAFLAEADRQHVFLSPSQVAEDGDTEGGAPVSIIEMAAAGMPIVATRHCDIPEVIEDGSTGLLAGEKDAEGLAALLIRLAESPESWPAMLDAGRRRMETEFNARVQGERLAGIYRTLSGR